MTVRELFNEAAIEQYQQLISCIQILVYKQAVSWTDDIQKLEPLIDPKYKKRYLQVAQEMGIEL
ncbi:hypothetical protein CHH65_13980 [Shouchella clausii]|uniref:Uncharacterized protein n=1 Tax=Shouchella clausii TaxID=79880 RepID=A0A268P586_SHOCL|nr:hypothetical protein CHH72_00395 [Shouchella clausii]PAF08692.1 hypothetical protein CHH65_13980 [Shouchella clausii]